MSRYSRQEIIPFIGPKGQQKLLNSKIAIIGCGALGSVAAELAARSGVGNIFLFDKDIVEEVNLQRQSCYSEMDINAPKSKALKLKLHAINSTIEISASTTHINSTTIQNIDVDLIIDGTDNVETREIIDKFCLDKKIPWVMGSGIRDRGYVFPILIGGPRYKDAFPRAAQAKSCEEFGVLATTTHMIASMQITEAFKILLGMKVESQLYSLSVLDHKIESFKVNKHDHQDEKIYSSPYHIRHCHSKKGIVFHPTKHYPLNMEWIKEKYTVTLNTDLLLILDDEIYVYSYGEIIFKNNISLEDAKTKALEIYSVGGIEFA